MSIVPWQLLINTNTEPLNNDKLREAISYAIDYDAIRNATCSGYVSAKDSTIVFATPELNLPSSVQQYKYDPEKARQLVAECGLPTPVDVGEIIGGNNNGSAEMIQQYLQAVGIQAQVTSYETNTFVQMLMGGQFGLGSNQPYNFNKFSNAEVDAILEKMQHTSDAGEIETLLAQALNIIAAQHTNINLGMPARYVVYSSSLEVPPTFNGVDMIRVK